MNTNSIIREINKLPLTDKLLLVEKTLKAIRQEKEKNINNVAFENKTQNKKFVSFETIKIDTSNYKFNRDEANER